MDFDKILSRPVNHSHFSLTQAGYCVSMIAQRCSRRFEVLQTPDSRYNLASCFTEKFVINNSYHQNRSFCSKRSMDLLREKVYDCLRCLTRRIYECIVCLVRKEYRQSRNSDLSRVSPTEPLSHATKGFKQSMEHLGSLNRRHRDLVKRVDALEASL